MIVKVVHECANKFFLMKNKPAMRKDVDSYEFSHLSTKALSFINWKKFFNRKGRSGRRGFDELKF